MILVEQEVGRAVGLFTRWPPSVLGIVGVRGPSKVRMCSAISFPASQVSQLSCALRGLQTVSATKANQLASFILLLPQRSPVQGESCQLCL